jgi:transketolase
VEQASVLGWERYTGPNGAIVGMQTFGVSAPLKAVAAKFGFTPEAVGRLAKDRIAAARGQRSRQP